MDRNYIAPVLNVLNFLPSGESTRSLLLHSFAIVIIGGSVDQHFGFTARSGSILNDSLNSSLNSFLPMLQSVNCFDQCRVLVRSSSGSHILQTKEKTT